MESKVALVTGANRGLGLETAGTLLNQGHYVFLGVRNASKGKEAAKGLEGTWEILELDVASEKSVEKAVQSIREQKRRLDILVNNAGVFPDDETFEVSREGLRSGFETNVLGVFHLCQRAIPLMKSNGFGRIVNLSSGMGQLSEMGSGHPTYRISKTAVNGITRLFSQETLGDNILVNSVCPGWVRTDMGGPSAHRSLSEGAETIVWAATLPDGGPTGSFFRDKKTIPW